MTEVPHKDAARLKPTNILECKGLSLTAVAATTSTVGNAVQHSRALSSDSVVSRANGFLEAEIDGEVVALNIAKGTCYGLNRVGSRIWYLLAGPARVSEVCARLHDEYNVDPRDCEYQVLDLLEDLRAEGLVTLLGKT